MAVPLQKRANDLFVSYGHADQPLVTPLVEWLRRVAGCKVWYDAWDGDASKRTTMLLSNAVQSARGALFVLSPNWTRSTWCTDEHELALNERRTDDGFLVLAVRVADLDLPSWFKIANVVDFRQFAPSSAAELLRSMNPNPPSRLDNSDDVYYAGPWSRPTKSATAIIRAMRGLGWRVVGDSPDNPHFSDAESRITATIRSSRGLVAVLPYDERKSPAFTSPWILEEARIANLCGQPYLLFAEDRVCLPDNIAARSFGGRPISISSDQADGNLLQALQAFEDELQQCPRPSGASCFLATSLLGDARSTDDLVMTIERASNMSCVLGQGLTGQHAQKEIVTRIQEAAFVIADVSDDHKNSMIEAGIALGAGIPLHIMSRRPETGPLKTRFMFQDMEVNWYDNPVERLGIVYRIARTYRRRVYADA
jgi:hypothetical protein